MTVLEALIVFSMGWSLRATVDTKWCFKCATRKLLLATARRLIKKKDSSWRLRGAIMLVLFEPGIDLLKILGWKRIQRMVQNAGRKKEADVPTVRR